MAEGRAKWLVNVALYTLAGAGTSALLGGVLGSAGSHLVPSPLRRDAGPVVLALALLAAARELGWVRFPLPQARRQTNHLWAKLLPTPVAATLWGLDLGLLFTTWHTFSGPWVLASIALLHGDAAFGAVLLLAYWLGRAVPVWIGPLLLPDAGATPGVLASIHDRHRTYQLIHAAGLGMVITYLALSLS